MFDRSRRRLAYWFTLSMGSILILFAFTLYYIQLREKISTSDRALYTQSKYIASKTKYQLDRGKWQIEPEDISIRAMKFQARSKYQTFNSDRFCQKNKHRELLRQLTLPIIQNKVAIGYLQVANSLCSTQEELAKTQLLLSLGVPLTLSLTGLVGWFLGGVAMKPTQKSYEQLQRFTADASHELRAPIAAILSNAQVGLLSPESDRIQPRQRLENIVNITKSTSSLISNLLFLARHEGQLNPDDLEAIDLRIFLQFLIDEFKILAAEKKLNIHSNLSSSAIEIKGDRELLQQALKNLLNNAYKYTSSGGTVRLTLITKSRRAIVEVEDNGIGIPAEDLPHIFDRFYRVDTARSRETGGFGLGLAIAQQIIRAHNGQITVESTFDKGTKFQIVLPLISCPAK
jgi:two-component system, OmpR family, manganese sensing sensor histidine kinase